MNKEIEFSHNLICLTIRMIVIFNNFRQNVNIFKFKIEIFVSTISLSYKATCVDEYYLYCKARQ